MVGVPMCKPLLQGGGIRAVAVDAGLFAGLADNKAEHGPLSCTQLYLESRMQFMGLNQCRDLEVPHSGCCRAPLQLLKRANLRLAWRVAQHPGLPTRRRALQSSQEAATQCLEPFQMLSSVSGSSWHPGADRCASLMILEGFLLD